MPRMLSKTWKRKYALSASIDPYGHMIIAGIMNDLGSIGLYDFEMKANRDRLSMEEAKGLLYVTENGHVSARYHEAVFPENVARFWAINYGKDVQNKPDITGWFRKEDLHALVCLSEENYAHLEMLGSNNQAIARRAVIFSVNENFLKGGTQSATYANALD